MALSSPIPLDARVLAWHRASLEHDMSTGQAMQLVFPLAFLGPFIIPILWTATPHTPSTAAYPLLAHPLAKLLVALACFVSNASIVWARMTSDNVLLSYYSGLSAAWGFMMGFRFILVTDPQEEAARVIRVRRRKQGKGRASTESIGGGDDEHDGGHVGVGVGVDVDDDVDDDHNAKVNGPATESRQRRTMAQASADRDEGRDEGKDESKNGEYGYDYYWQPFPADAPLPRRLNWAFDLFTSIRGSGWTWGVPIIPQPSPPKTPIAQSKALQPAFVSSIPMRTKHGYTRPATQSAYLASALARYAVTYLIVDVLITMMRHDPYFILGPAYRHTPSHAPHALPPILQSVPEWGLALCRSLVLFSYIVAALHFVMCIHDLMQYFLLGRAIPLRKEPWVYASFFGGFDQVLDRGLAGFWGAWWHQAFRVPFTAPTDYLVKHAYVSSPRSAGALVCNLVCPFLASGLFHACASSTTHGHTAVWRPFAFFALAGLGTGLQQVLCLGAAPAIGEMPRWVRRAGNLAFVSVWLNTTSWLFADDLASSGFLLLEPVPVSFARMIGLGLEGDSWCRHESRSLAWWHRGRHWWQSGLAM